MLTPQEIDELIQIMKRLIESGKTIIIITHKLKEIKRSADYCTVIRRGEYIDTVAVAEVSQEDLASMMVGRKVRLAVEKTEAEPKEVVFEVSKLNAKDERGVQVLNDLSFQVRAGEIFGIAGVDGNGQTELVEAITNLRKVDSGTIRIRGLSGGNQQKVIIGREIANDPELLIAVQPTRGLDVGAIEYVHKTLIRERDKGKAILLISLELDEILNVADTIGVIYDGSINAILSRSEADENSIGLLMAGGTLHE